MRVVDMFCVNNELDLLEYRLRILGDVVDEFFVIESPLTFTGQPKPLFVSDARERFAPWKDKLILHVVETPADASEAWGREHAQHRPKRAHIEASCAEDDVILLGDVDEVPRPELIARLAAEGICEPVRLLMFHAEYRANWVRRVPWDIGTQVFRPPMVDEPVLQFRLGNPVHPNHPMGMEVPDAGWHLSSLGTAEDLRAKLAAYSHQEFNQRRDRVPGHIERCIRWGVHVTGELVLHPIPRSDLDPMLVPFLDLRPDLFDFETEVPRLGQRAWAGWTWLRRRRFIPEPLVRSVDRWSTMVTGPLASLFAAVDTLRRGVAKWRRSREDRSSPRFEKLW